MRATRVLAWLLGGVALAVSLFLLQERRLIGFPDGFVSEQDRVRKVLLGMSSGASLLAGLGFASLGWVAPRRPGTGKKLGAAGVAYAVFLALVLVADHHLKAGSGRGG